VRLRPPDRRHTNWVEADQRLPPYIVPGCRASSEAGDTFVNSTPTWSARSEARTYNNVDGRRVPAILDDKVGPEPYPVSGKSALSQ
jgi:hypothetical protein